MLAQSTGTANHRRSFVMPSVRPISEIVGAAVSRQRSMSHSPSSSRSRSEIRDGVSPSILIHMLESFCGDPGIHMLGSIALNAVDGLRKHAAPRRWSDYECPQHLEVQTAHHQPPRQCDRKFRGSSNGQASESTPPGDLALLAVQFLS